MNPATMPPMFDSIVRGSSRLVLASARVACVATALWACSSDPVTGTDAVVAADADPATPIDGGVPNADATPIATDATPGPPDAGPVGNDAAPMSTDAGMMGTNELGPGSHVTIAGVGRIGIGDTYTETIARLGAGVRSMGMAQRSYEWTLAGGVELTVWFTNTNLDRDDDPPNDVDGTDRVLWIAVSGAFAGRTPAGIGLGSTKAALETAYGMSPRTTPLTMPMPGELTSYYARGFLAAFGQDGALRTFTVTKAYLRAPDGRIDIAAGRLVFGNDSIRMNALTGAEPNDIRQLLGPPDSEGPIPDQNDFEILNYAFIGVEFIISTLAGDHAASAIVHSPYYGTPGIGTPGLGSTRTDFEAYAAQTLRVTAGPTPSRNTMGLFCFTLPAGGARTFGVTYSMAMPQVVTAIIVGSCQ